MGIALVQSKLGGNGSGSSPVTSSAVGYASTTTSGNLLVLIAWAKNTTSALAPIITAATSGFVWTNAKTAAYSDSGTPQAGKASIFYIEDAGAMSATTTVTAALGVGPSLSVEFSLYEFSGILTSGSLDQIANTSSGTGNPSTANLVLTATDLVIVTYTGEGTNTTAGPSYTLGVNSTHVTASQTQYILNHSPGSTATAFGGTDPLWGCASASFSSTGGAGASKCISSGLFGF